MIEVMFDRILGFSPQFPRRITTGVGYAMNDWLENHLNGLTRAAGVCTDDAVRNRAILLKQEAVSALNSLEALMQYGQGDFRLAAKLIVRYIDEQIPVICSHELNASIWGVDQAMDIENHAVLRVREALFVFCQIDPQWATRQEKILEKYSH